MKRKRKLIPLELQKRYDKLLDIVPELETVQDVQRSLDIIKSVPMLKALMRWAMRLPTFLKGHG